MKRECRCVRKGVEVLRSVEGSLLLTEIHDEVQEAADIWSNHHVWFDADNQAILGVPKKANSQPIRCDCINGFSLPACEGACPFCEKTTNGK